VSPEAGTPRLPSNQVQAEEIHERAIRYRNDCDRGRARQFAKEYQQTFITIQLAERGGSG
jgi:hypothetical protein